MTVKFRTVLSPSVCKERISLHADKGSWYTDITNMFTHGKEIEYKFEDNKFQLKKVRPYLRNALQVTFFGEFIKEKDSNYISGKYRMNRFGVIFLIIWEVLVIAVCIFIFIMTFLHLMNSSLLPERIEFSGNYFALLIPLMMPIFGYVMYRFGKEIANRDIKIINTFIEQHCNAVQISKKK